MRVVEFVEDDEVDIDVDGFVVIVDVDGVVVVFGLKFMFVDCDGIMFG